MKLTPQLIVNNTKVVEASWGPVDHGDSTLERTDAFLMGLTAMTPDHPCDQTLMQLSSS